MNHFTRMLFVLLLTAFSLPAWAGLLSQRTTISTAGPYTNYEFGSTGVVISNDGMKFVIGLPGSIQPPSFGDGTGSGQLLRYVNGQWIGNGEGFVSGPTTAGEFGTGLALSADGGEMFFGFGISCVTGPGAPACIGPAQAEVLNTVPNTQFTGFFPDPTNTPNLASNFGSTGALSGDGRVLLVGAPEAISGGVLNAGQVLIYTYTGTGSVWSAPVVLSDPGATQYDEFGMAVALSADGQTALIGSRTAGGGVSTTIYVYRLNAGTWSNVQTITLAAGFLCQMCQGYLALSSDGQTAIVSTSTGANVYTFSSGWNSFTPASITLPNGDGYGAVAISADGSSVLIGTEGAVYQYNLNAGAWGLQQTFNDPGTLVASGFGQTGVALSADKETAVITAGFATAGGYLQAGLAYAYQSPADLSIAGTATPDEVSLGQQTALAFTVTNHDTAVTAYNVVLTDTLPAGFTGIGTNAGAGASCSVSGQTVTCTRSSLAPGAVWSPGIQASVTTAGNYTDTASVTSNQPDPDTSNNSVNLSISMLPPTVANGSLTVNADTTGGGNLTGTNPCNCGTLAYSVVQAPAHGTVKISNAVTGAFSYTPDAGYLGSDSFTFQLANGYGTSASATESITVKDVPPTATGGSVTTNVNQAVSGTLAATPGYAEQKLSFAIAAQPLHGAVTITDAATGAFTYTPAAGYIGTDSFTFTAGDGTVTSAAATEGVTIKDVPPTALNGSVTTAAGESVSGTLSATPGYTGQKLTFTAVTPPAHGTVNVTNAASGAFTYTPNVGYVGTDSFSFVAGDGTVTSMAATVTVAVQDVAPTAANGSATTKAGQPVNGTLAATPGYTGQMLSYAVVTQPAHGKVTLTASSGAYTYTPDSGFVGNDSFTFMAGDGIVTSATATVSVTVQDVVPTANNGSASTTAGQAVSGTLAATPGYPGQTLAFNVVTQPAHGGLTYDTTTGAYTYTPASGYSGSDSFTFTAGDGTLTSPAATESITVKPSASSGGSSGGGAFGLFGLGMLAGLLGIVRRRRR